ncbi:uncharacterized protein LOC143423170 [Xylocopa sonorina]|uniref:uncharacterized protein LOC143423170 n=1 Tax=Xylocopa sonorina TaxID=1818115 RepID=UPI00403B2183
MRREPVAIVIRLLSQLDRMLFNRKPLTKGSRRTRGFIHRDVSRYRTYIVRMSPAYVSLNCIQAINIRLSSWLYFWKQEAAAITVWVVFLSSYVCIYNRYLFNLKPYILAYMICNRVITRLINRFMERFRKNLNSCSSKFFSKLFEWFIKLS